MKKAVICGGSIGGLFAAAALRKSGWQVDVFERTVIELSGRGAGIVTHDVLIDALKSIDITTDELGVFVKDRTAYDKSGNEVLRLPFPQIVTSWDRIHSLLRASHPNKHHHLGRSAIGFRQEQNKAVAILDDKTEFEADLVIGADGFGSKIRTQMLPDIKPVSSGYVVWRALANESDLSEEVRSDVFKTFGFFVPTGSQIIGYPIAGPGNDLREGHRRYNFVWYIGVEQSELKDMLTDDNGKYYSVSIPPPLVREDVMKRFTETARQILPANFAEILEKSEMPFFTPIYDHHSPVMGTGNVGLVGDAACVARPHVGMGVTKAACDALCLARSLDSYSTIPEALEAYSEERVAASARAHYRARDLGATIFVNPEGGNEDGRSNPNLYEIVSTTATIVK
ncbi:MAG: FAD-dependent monooxygenase [Alphaproteobacteria bacterium]|nr:FAD-dependent monooxygenase [Alphaproteobacteria bacterium]